MFTISIEPLNGSAFRLPSTIPDEKTARLHAQNVFNAPTINPRSVAVFRNSILWDVFDGQWMTEIAWNENENLS